jgi:hypothetical protein
MAHLAVHLGVLHPAAPPGLGDSSECLKRSETLPHDAVRLHRPARQPFAALLLRVGGDSFQTFSNEGRVS